MSVAADKFARRRRKAYRHDLLWIAALVHRLSGLMLALFLPLHFLTLGLAIEGEAKLDGFLRWTDLPVVKVAEAVLVFLLAVHLLGGMRILMVENFAWRGGHRALVALGAGCAAVLAILFLVAGL
jgi:fumarate reductase subunit D